MENVFRRCGKVKIVDIMSTAISANAASVIHRCTHGAATCVDSWVTSTVLLLSLSRPRCVALRVGGGAEQPTIAGQLTLLQSVLTDWRGGFWWFVCCSSPMACGFGTCPPARATPSCWLTGTACSPSCSTVVSSRS